MTVVIFGSVRDRLKTVLAKKIHKQLPAVDIRCFFNTADLSQALNRPVNQIVVIIMLIYDEGQLLKIHRLHPGLENIDLVFVMVENDSFRARSRALEFSPSFITGQDGLDDVVTVATRLIRRMALRMGKNGLI